MSFNPSKNTSEAFEITLKKRRMDPSFETKVWRQSIRIFALKNHDQFVIKQNIKIKYRNQIKNEVINIREEKERGWDTNLWASLFC